VTFLPRKSQLDGCQNDRCPAMTAMERIAILRVRGAPGSPPPSGLIATGVCLPGKAAGMRVTSLLP
jgi:hypothetical protein